MNVFCKMTLWTRQRAWIHYWIIRDLKGFQMIRQEILSYSEKERGGDGGVSESMDAYCKDFSFFATYLASFVGF